MKTAITINKALWKRFKRMAIDRDTTVKELMADVVRRAVEEYEAQKQ